MPGIKIFKSKDRVVSYAIYPLPSAAAG